MPCPFCQPDPALVFLETELVIGVMDGRRETRNDALLVPRRHVTDWFALSVTEQHALVASLPTARDALLATCRPDAFHIGIAVGDAAGQAVAHAHVRVSPRFAGESPEGDAELDSRISGSVHARLDPTPLAPTPGDGDARGAGHLIRGGSDPLLPRLLGDLVGATRLDIAVAFVLPSGVARLEEHLRDLLRREDGHVRVVTGDYLDVTDPDSLLQLLDLDGSGRLELFAFETTNTSYHPKAYVIQGRGRHGRAYVGSSNLSRTALESGGVEWNYRIVSSSDREGFASVCDAFEALLEHPSVRRVDVDWIERYRSRRRTPMQLPIDVVVEPSPSAPEPHAIQCEALEALEATRREGNRAGLVVLATGLGKTWLSAFDSQAFAGGANARVLFVAHREEILEQARKTYRRIRPSAHLGLFTGREKIPDADVLFASVQTLSRAEHLRRFDPGHFDYIVVDEFHHAAAATYRKLIDHFEPRFLLGLTATPERTDGGDLLSLCGENLVFRCDLVAGIERDLLCPFHYFGVPDEVDYANIPWRSSRFDEAALTDALATRERARNALEQYRARGGERVLAFCCSKIHADFMASFFRAEGVRAVAVHSGDSSAPRAASLEKLNAGELNIVFAVDMFNEGVDLPAIDTVLMLRPTESRVLWLQQFGRGLRKAPGKEQLRVIDYIGNHRSFLQKPQALFGLGVGDHEVACLLKQLRENTRELPPGCEVTYDLEAIEILGSLLRSPAKDEALRAYYEDFRERHGQRPTAVEAFHDGYNPGTLRKGYGSWFGFVSAMGDLSPGEETAFREHGKFLDELEASHATRGHELLVVYALLNLDCLPGEASVEELAGELHRLALRSARLRSEIGDNIDDIAALESRLEKSAAVAGSRANRATRRRLLAYEARRVRGNVDVANAGRAEFQRLVREIVDWQLARRLAREASLDEFECKVSRSGDAPILFLPDRKSHPGLPEGWTELFANESRYRANFVKIALNVVRDLESEENRLPELLCDWFGPDAGKPGTRHRVRLVRSVDGWTLDPVERRQESDAQRWATYLREEIPPLFGHKFGTNVWNQGLIVKPDAIFLLVTLNKKDLAEDHRYEDRFLSARELQWQSQNRTKQDGKHGRAIRDHRKDGRPVHLFVRREKKISSRTQPFTYCGPVEFVDWHGESPITVRWRLAEELPERLRERFGV